MIKLSLVIIALNEEKNIAKCLEAASSVADEIIIIDSLSTDRTAETSESFGAKVIQHPFENFVKQKNIAIDAASNDWILSLDADEILSTELCLSIKTIKENPAFDGYFMNRLTNYCGKWVYHCGWYPDAKLRLFNRQKARWTGHLIHEKIEMSVESQTGKLKGDLLHYSYYSISDHIKQADKFSAISAQELFEKGRKATAFKLVMGPVFKFLRDYVLKMGFLDGFYGYVICRISAHAAFLKYAHLKNLQKTSSKK